MGTNSPNETKCLCKYTPEGQILNTSIYAEFEKAPFQDGTFRYCFKGTIKNLYGDKVYTNDFSSGKCVVKVYKNLRYFQDYNIDFICSMYAYQEAQLFNQIIKIPNKFNFIIPYGGSVHLLSGFKLFGLFKVSTNKESKQFLLPNMKVSIEPFLDGTYTKFSSNSGYENPDFDAYIPAFSHFTWIHSKGRKVVLDVQGIFKNGRYYLTDPACQSLEQLYGNSDLGAMGLIKFLMCHKHNNICQNWKWVPKEISGILKSYNTLSIKRTSFKFENEKNIKTYTPIYINLLKMVRFD